MAIYWNLRAYEGIRNIADKMLVQFRYYTAVSENRYACCFPIFYTFILPAEKNSKKKSHLICGDQFSDPHKLNAFVVRIMRDINWN